MNVRADVEVMTFSLKIHTRKAVFLFILLVVTLCGA